MKTLRQRSAVAALALAVGMIGMTACSKDEKPAPTTSTTTTTTTAPASSSVAPPAPTEKSPGGGGPNSFTPSVKAPPAPTATPGNN